MAKKSETRRRAKTVAKNVTARKSSAASGPTIPKLLDANVSPHSIGGLSMFDFD